MQDLNVNQSKLEVHDTYEKDEKITKNIEPVNNQNVINKVYLDQKWSKLDGHLSLSEKYYNDFKLQYNKQPVDEILIQRAVKTTMQILHDKGLFDGFPKTDEVLKEFSFVTRRRGDLKQIKCSNSMIFLIII